MVEATFGTKPGEAITVRFLNKLCAAHRRESTEPALGTSRRDCDWCTMERLMLRSEEGRRCS